MKFEAGKEYRTRDGCKARVYATDGVGLWSIHGAILGEQGWVMIKWKDNGRSSMVGETTYDLMPPAREVYIIEKEIGSLMPDWFVDKGHCMDNAVHTPGGRVRTFREVLDNE